MIGSIRKCPSLSPKGRNCHQTTCATNTGLPHIDLLNADLAHKYSVGILYLWNLFFDIPDDSFVKIAFLVISSNSSPAAGQFVSMGLFLQTLHQAKIGPGKSFYDYSTYNYIQEPWLRGFCLPIWKPRAYLLAKESPCMFCKSAKCRRWLPLPQCQNTFKDKLGPCSC